jgi:hypothetical protein
VTRAKISEYSATANDNTDVNGINIAENCPPSSMNNMGREIMAALKRFQVGSDGDGVTVGGALVVSGATSANTFTGTVVNATTIDTTNIEVTNIKAKDGTASASIADSTGVITVTKDAVVNGLTVGRGAGAVSTNTAVGASALAANEAGGTDNTAIGYQALDANTTGDQNTAVGSGALDANTTANNNTAVGYQAGYSNQTGTLNCFFGGFAGYSVTAGGNAAFGYTALFANTSGTGNAAFGTAISGVTEPALRNNTTGSYNTAIGTSALAANTTASNNTAVGYQALYANTATGNTAVGYQAGDAITTGEYNTLLGFGAGGALTTGTLNTFVGVGFTSPSGSLVTTGSKNTILGGYNGNQGGLDIRTASNQIVLSDGDGNPRGFCNGNNWIFGDQTASQYWPIEASVSGQDAITINRSTGYIGIASSDASPIYIDRNTSDGDLIRFYQAGVQEGSISVSGNTVSYNGGHLSRWAQMLGEKDTSLVKGTVMSNLDDMNEYFKDGQPVENEQLNKVKVSDVEGDANVAGVFVNWTYDEAHQVDEINMAMTGDMIIRIAQGVTVARGDLLMSAGDGTAKPQGDDIVRSKTIAKVTSTHVTCTYDDGSYCVPCVLMAC